MTAPTARISCRVCRAAWGSQVPTLPAVNQPWILGAASLGNDDASPASYSLVSRELGRSLLMRTEPFILLSAPQPISEM